MQVNNNVQSPNFGMALKISKGAKESLRKNLSLETLEKLQKAGEDLKDTKFYHVKVDNDLHASITADKDAYFGLFKTKDYSTTYGVERLDGRDVTSDRILLINDKNQNTIAGVGRYEPYLESKPCFDVWGPLVPYLESKPIFNAWGPFGAYNKVGDVPELAKIAKIFDGVAAEKSYQLAAKNAEKAAEQAKISKTVDDLIDNFGV